MVCLLSHYNERDCIVMYVKGKDKNIIVGKRLLANKLLVVNS